MCARVGGSEERGSQVVDPQSTSCLFQQWINMETTETVVNPYIIQSSLLLPSHRQQL